MAYNLLKGKRGIIFGALDDKSIAWKVAMQAHEEGAEFTLSNTETALRFGMTNELAEKYLTLAAQYDPTDFSIWIALGKIRLKQNNKAGAETAFEKAKAIRSWAPIPKTNK